MSRHGQMESEVSEGGEGQGTKEERDKKGKKGGCTMTSPPSYAATSQSGIASLFDVGGSVRWSECRWGRSAENQGVGGGTP